MAKGWLWIIGGGLLIFVTYFVDGIGIKDSITPRLNQKTRAEQRDEARRNMKSSVPPAKEQMARQGSDFTYKGHDIDSVEIVDDWANGHRAVGRTRISDRQEAVTIYYDWDWNLKNIRIRSTMRDLE